MPYLRGTCTSVLVIEYLKFLSTSSQCCQSFFRPTCWLPCYHLGYIVVVLLTKTIGRPTCWLPRYHLGYVVVVLSTKTIGTSTTARSLDLQLVLNMCIQGIRSAWDLPPNTCNRTNMTKSPPILGGSHAPPSKLCLITSHISWGTNVMSILRISLWGEADLYHSQVWHSGASFLIMVLPPPTANTTNMEDCTYEDLVTCDFYSIVMFEICLVDLSLIYFGGMSIIRWREHTSRKSHKGPYFGVSTSPGNIVVNASFMLRGWTMICWFVCSPPPNNNAFFAYSSTFLASIFLWTQ